MNLSLKQKAAAFTAAFIASIVVASYALAFIIANVDRETISYVLGLGFFSWFVYLIYGITLSSLEYKQKLKEIVDNK
jgi:hypothetical protein